MKRLLSWMGMFGLAAFLAMPVITLPGGVYLAILIASVAFLRGRVLTSGVWQLCVLGIYALLIGAAFAQNFHEWREINNQQMRQVSIGLLAFATLRKASFREINTLLAIILAIAVAGVVGEMAGHNMHMLLPSKIAETEYYKDVATLPGGEQRFRGVFSESSVLLAVTTAYGFQTVAGAILLRRSSRKLWLVASAAVALVSMVFLLAVTLAKTGLVVAAGGIIGCISAALIRREHRRVLRWLAAAAAMAVLVAPMILILPKKVTNYIAEEVSALPRALEGDRSLVKTNFGLLTRVECWRLAFETVINYPLGVGEFGIDDAYQASESVTLTSELRFLFSVQVYGLKSALANVMAQTGLPGLLLLAATLFCSFIRPLYTDTDPRGGPATLRLAALMMAVLFLSSCETYYWMAFVIVLRCHADAAAREMNSPLPASRSGPRRGIRAVFQKVTFARRRGAYALSRER